MADETENVSGNESIPLDSLDYAGICCFTDPKVTTTPTGISISAAEADILELVTDLVYNKPGPGFAMYAFDVSQKEPVPAEVVDRIIGVKLDNETIQFLQDQDPRAILLSESDGDVAAKGLTPAEWKAKYATDGLAALARARLYLWFRGGGIQAQPVGNRKLGVTATKLPGSGQQRIKEDGVKYFKIGGT